MVKIRETQRMGFATLRKAQGTADKIKGKEQQTKVVSARIFADKELYSKRLTQIESATGAFDKLTGIKGFLSKVFFHHRKIYKGLNSEKERITAIVAKLGTLLTNATDVEGKIKEVKDSIKTVEGEIESSKAEIEKLIPKDFKQAGSMDDVIKDMETEATRMKESRTTMRATREKFEETLDLIKIHHKKLKAKEKKLEDLKEARAEAKKHKQTIVEELQKMA